LTNLGKQARVCDNCYESLSGIPVQTKRSRRISVAPKSKDTRQILEESESKATLAKRATMLLSKSATASSSSRNVRKPNSVYNLPPSEHDGSEVSEASTTMDASEATDTLTTNTDGDASDNEDSKANNNNNDDKAEGEKSKRKKGSSSSSSSKKKKKRSASNKKCAAPAAEEDLSTKPLEDWSADQVEHWLTTYENGKFSRFASTFIGVAGADIASLTEAQICAHIPGLVGSVLYNKLKAHTGAGMMMMMMMMVVRFGAPLTFSLDLLMCIALEARAAEAHAAAPAATPHAPLTTVTTTADATINTHTEEKTTLVAPQISVTSPAPTVVPRPIKSSLSAAALAALPAPITPTISPSAGAIAAKVPPPKPSVPLPDSPVVPRHSASEESSNGSDSSDHEGSSDEEEIRALVAAKPPPARVAIPRPPTNIPRYPRVAAPPTPEGEQ
jgi:hypothetical protein